MSCISSNFSSFFLNSLNDPSEFTKYLSNGELKMSPFEEFQVQTQTSQQHPQYSQQQAQLPLNGASVAYYASNSNNNNNIHTSSSSGSSSSNNHINTNSNNVGNASMTNGGIIAAGMPPSSSSNSTMEVFNGATHIEAANYSSQQQQHATSVIHQPQHQQSHLHHPHQNHSAPHPHPPHAGPYGHAASAANGGAAFHHNHHQQSTAPPPHYAGTPQRWPTSIAANGITTTPGSLPHTAIQPGTPLGSIGAQHFDGSFEFLKYLRHSNDYSEAGETQGSGNSASPASNGVHLNHQLPSHQQQQHHHHHQQQQQQSPSSSLIDLDNSTKHKSRSSRKVAALLSSVSRASNSLDSTSLDVFDHDSKHTMFDLHHMTNSSNSNESNLEISSIAFPNSHLNASNSNTSSEGAAAGSTDFAMLHSSSNAPKPLANFVIKDNFEAHPSHKVEEGIFQHMNKLPPKKKENLKQLGVRFTGQMTLADKSIVVENFIRFCQEYDIKDHRPFLSLNQSGLNKPDQIKFARYLGQGLPTFTLFCIYSNFKNLFCTKRTEIYTKDGYNLPYILDKTKRFLSNTTAGI